MDFSGCFRERAVIPIMRIISQTWIEWKKYAKSNRQTLPFEGFRRSSKGMVFLVWCLSPRMMFVNNGSATDSLNWPVEKYIEINLYENELGSRISICVGICVLGETIQWLAC
jgi:hypothetical protein